ncbi:hypothetical protein [Nocardioides dongxiaopingii]|uniref:hypothetical protein n=1 Tax=Nocardioides dongxiaopingii TaxID=2576036 RepID=UPI0010C7629A|nr:hypothetical protein [Nocardioides dongxiaopingii]
MKLRRRSEVPEPDATPGVAPAVAPAAPTDRLAAAFAGVLDGRRLWVAVEHGPDVVAGTFGLRDVATGDVVAPPDDDAGDQPGHLAARLDLTALPDGPGPHDVVLLPAGAGGARPLWTPPLGAHRSPLAPDGRSRFALARADDGTLRVRREPVPAAAWLDLVRVGGEGAADVVLRLSGPGATLRLVADDDVELATWPVRDGTAVLAADALAALDGVAPQVARLLLDDLPVRRHDHDLADPARAVPLPEIGRLRLRWSPPGLLQARVLDEQQERGA